MTSFLHYLSIGRTRWWFVCSKKRKPSGTEICGADTDGQMHTHLDTVPLFLTNESTRELTLLQPLCSHPTKGCQIDFDNKFQLRLCINFCYKWHTYIFHSGERTTLRVDIVVRVRVSTQGHLLHSRQSSSFWIIFPLFHFLPMLKGKQVSNDEDGTMWHSHRERERCITHAQMHRTIKHRNPAHYKFVSITCPLQQNTPALTNNFDRERIHS